MQQAYAEFRADMTHIEMSPTTFFAAFANPSRTWPSPGQSNLAAEQDGDEESAFETADGDESDGASLSEAGMDELDRDLDAVLRGFRSSRQ